MIDVLASQKANEIDLVLHFVNKDMDPSKAPQIKRFTLVNDAQTKDFLRKFEDFARIASPFYQK